MKFVSLPVLMRLPILLCSTGLLLACQPLASSDTATTESSHAVEHLPVQKGIYVWGSEVETFTPCGTERTFWLEGDETLLEPLREIALQLADAHNEAYQPVYVEIQAIDAGKATDGLAVEYDGVQQLKGVLYTSTVIPATCAQHSAYISTRPQQG